MAFESKGRRSSCGFCGGRDGIGGGIGVGEQRQVGGADGSNIASGEDSEGPGGSE